MDSPPHIAAHKHSSRHRTEVLASERCGCFYCLAIFEPSEIWDWLDETRHKDGEVISYEPTARCPHCGIDSVIGSASGYPITREFLQTMKSHWFEPPVTFT